MFYQYQKDCSIRFIYTRIEKETIIKEMIQTSDTFEHLSPGLFWCIVEIFFSVP